MFDISYQLKDNKIKLETYDKIEINKYIKNEKNRFNKQLTIEKK